jgi:hypothetical protein
VVATQLGHLALRPAGCAHDWSAPWIDQRVLGCGAFPCSSLGGGESGGPLRRRDDVREIVRGPSAAS